MDYQENDHSKGGFFMQIQASTDYALRILQYLDQHKNELPTAMTISKAVGITYPFFIKIATQLKQSGLLYAVQGRNGGYSLNKPATEINIYDVFLAIEGPLEINRCLKEDGVCPRNEDGDCKFHIFFGDVQASIIETMSSKVIADFAE